jgi:hypothetical protein
MMLRQLSELETVLQQLIAEHRKLLGHVDAQQQAMRKLDLAAIDAAAGAQEACRLRIATMETRRRGIVAQLTRGVKNLEQPVPLSKIGALYPQRRDALLKLGNELREVATSISAKTKIASKLANAVLGHLNTVVRLLAGAVERAGLYTKDGVPRVSGRIGVMEAVG